MSQNPYDQEDRIDLRLWCPKQLFNWGVWFWPVAMLPFLLFNWFKLREYKEILLAVLWVIPGALLFMSPPLNWWALFGLYIIYANLWKHFSCQRQVRYAEEELYGCYSMYPVFIVILTGGLFITSFFIYLTNSVVVPGFPNREQIVRYEQKNIKLYTSVGFNEEYRKRFFDWMLGLNKADGMARLIHLRQVDGVIQVRLFMVDEMMNDSMLGNAMAVLAVQHSEKIFSGTATEIHLCGNLLETQVVVKPKKSHKEHFVLLQEIQLLSKLISVDYTKRNKKIIKILSDSKDVIKGIEEVSSILKEGKAESQEISFNDKVVRDIHARFITLQDKIYEAWHEVFIGVVNGDSASEIKLLIKNTDKNVLELQQELLEFQNDEFKKL